MEMVFNPRTGQNECPPGSLLDTQRDVCVANQPQVQQPVQQNFNNPAPQAVNNVQRVQKTRDSDRIE